jgi:hypothetical protein
MQQFLLLKRRKIMAGVSKSSGPNPPTNPNDPNNPNNPNNPKNAVAYDPNDPLLASYDLDGDGKIDYDEWMQMKDTDKALYELDMNYKEGKEGFYKRKGTTSPVVA